jgi:hypothetical protein
MSEGQPVSKPVKKFSGAEGMFNDIWTQSYDISPSGKWYNFLPGPKTPQARIEVVTNWFSELNRAIPLRR